MSKTWAAKKKKKSQIKNRLSCFTESPADETSSNFNWTETTQTNWKRGLALCLKSADAQNETGNLLTLKKKICFGTAFVF